MVIMGSPLELSQVQSYAHNVTACSYSACMEGLDAWGQPLPGLHLRPPTPGSERCGGCYLQLGEWDGRKCVMLFSVVTLAIVGIS